MLIDGGGSGDSSYVGRTIKAKATFPQSITNIAAFPHEQLTPDSLISLMTRPNYLMIGQSRP